MSDHDIMKKRVMRAIEQLFGDMTVPREQTKESLEEIRDEMDMMIVAIEEDIAGNAKDE